MNKMKSEFALLCDNLRFSEDKSGSTEDVNRSRFGFHDYLARARSEGLRISPTLTPKLYEMIDTAKHQLGLQNTLEAFVMADPQPNAFTPMSGSMDHLVIVFTSGLIDLMEPTELLFVIGHELGHIGLNHVPFNPREGYESEYEALKNRSLARCSEISADRIGLVASRSLLLASSVMIKLASGLNSRHVTLDVNSFLTQLQQYPEEINRDWELELLYPSLPLRVWSLIQFSKSEPYLQYAGLGGNGIHLKELDKNISARLNNLGSGKLREISQRRFDMTITWMGAALVFEDGVVEKQEEHLLMKLVGKTFAQKALTFAESQGISAVYSKLETSLNELHLIDEAAHVKVLEIFRVFADKLNKDAVNCRTGKILERVY